MGTLLTVLIAGIFFYFDVISAGAYMLIMIAAVAWMGIAFGLYFKFGFLKAYYHDFLGWHVPENTLYWNDGCSEHTICKYCGKDIMQDSQGNWF